jgi:hypothetical protein
VEVIPIAVAAAKRVLPRVPGYEILAELGRGGMGVVYKARQIGFNRLVALKMLLSGAHAGADERTRFLREAEAVARLKHTGIVDVYAFGELDGCPYFSLEYMEGGSLADRLLDGPLPPREAAELTAALAQAAHYAHQHGVVHRDLKPANVLLTADGAPKIADFGLAKELAVEGQTQSGAVLGTPSYMAPEQAEGKSRRISPRTDVYALGAVLYEMLTGWPPFRSATTLDTLLRVLSEEPAAPRSLNASIPPDLESICLKCLSKAPDQRYASAQRLAEDLGCFLKGEAPRHTRPPGGWRRWNQAAWRETNTPLWSLVIGAVLLLAFTPFGGVHFAVLPIAATAAAAVLLTRAKISSLALTASSAASAIALIAFFTVKDLMTAGWLDPPWGELGLGAMVIGVVAPLIGLLLSTANRALSLVLLATAGLTAVSLILSDEPTALVLGLLIGVPFAMVGRVTARIARTPVGVALTGAFWGIMVNPCGCGPAGPLIMLLFVASPKPQDHGFSAGGDGWALVGFSAFYTPLYLIFAISGAIVNVWIYRSRRSLWERSAYASTLRRGGEDRTAGPEG